MEEHYYASLSSSMCVFVIIVANGVFSVFIHFYHLVVLFISIILLLISIDYFFVKPIQSTSTKFNNNNNGMKIYI